MADAATQRWPSSAMATWQRPKETDMAITERLRRFLDGEHVPYQAFPHREAFTAHDVAVATHVPERQLAKVVAVREEGGGYLLALLPAACRLDLTALRHAAGRRRLALVPERDMGALFPDCEIGAVPPFGNLYGLPVFVDSCFQAGSDIVFPGGNHHEVIRMAYRDYARLVQPIVGEFCLHEREKSSAG
jgi:Ala-tRNA(Pro) deacylase